MNKLIKVLFLTVVSVMVLAGCGSKENETGSNSQSQEEEQGLNIITTTFPSYDFARAVADEQDTISMLLTPGAESHSFDPSPQDIINIEKADIFIYIGGENEQWVETILESVDTDNKIILRLMDYVDVVEEEIVEGMEHDHDEDDEHDEDDHEDEDDHDDDRDHEADHEDDEHIWTSPSNAIALVNKIADTMIAVNPDNGVLYQENADAYTGQITEIIDEIHEIVADAKHSLMVFGDRFPFRYFADEFGLSYRAAFSGCSTETEASAGTVAYLIDKVRDEELSYIYYIELSNQNIARTICEETGADMLLLHSCHNVTKDEFEAGETYVSLMKQNAESLRKGLN